MTSSGHYHTLTLEVLGPNLQSAVFSGTHQQHQKSVILLASVYRYIMHEGTYP